MSTTSSTSSDQAAVAPELVPLDPRRLTAARTAYTTRFVSQLVSLDPHGYSLVRGTDVAPSPGDVVLARVSRVGQHQRLELSGGRRAAVFAGDEVLVAYGHRYAPDQFEAEVPRDLGPAHLVAAGGVAGTVLTSHASMARPTELVPVGLLANAYGVLTLRRCAPYALSLEPLRQRPPVVAVLGTSMNSGKTTAAAAVVRGLRQAGLDVAAGKVTGTGAGGDPHLFTDSGAATVLDFTDFGFATTYQESEQNVQALLLSVVRELSTHKPDVVVLEIADGLYQQETARLVADPLLARTVDRVVFAGSDALSAVAGTQHLLQRGLPVSVVTGMVTTSPLASREAQRALDTPVLGVDRLAEPEVLALLDLAGAQGGGSGGR